MKIIFVSVLLLAFVGILPGQERALIADGTAAIPVKPALGPRVEKLSAAERAAVKQQALAAAPEIDPTPKAMSSEESDARRDFTLLDVAEGFFIYREIRFRAYLYTAYSQKAARNYQGVLVLRALENRTRFQIAAHYVYEYRGDKYLRSLPDVNGNALSELAIYSEPPVKKDYRRELRIVEFSPAGPVKIGRRELYASIPQKQKFPWSPDKTKPARRVYTPPKITAVKLYVAGGIGRPLEFYEEELGLVNGSWQISKEIAPRAAGLDEDRTAYLELFKPVFPKGPGAK